jgi:carbon storage regulator
MLVLTRKVGQRIRVGEDVVITLVRIQGDKVRVGIDAPPHIAIYREEVHQRLGGGGRRSDDQAKPGDDEAALLRAPDPWA